MATKAKPSAFDEAVKAMRAPAVSLVPAAPAPLASVDQAIEKAKSFRSNKRDAASVAEYIQQRTDGMKVLVDRMVAIAEGTAIERRVIQGPRGEAEVIDAPVSIKDSIRAVEWLSDRALGRAPEHVVIDRTSVEARILRFEGMSTAQQMHWAALARALPGANEDVVDVEPVQAEPVPITEEKD